MAKYRTRTSKDSSPQVHTISLPQDTMFSIIAGVVSIGIAWGIVKAKVASMIEEQRSLTDQLAKLKDHHTQTREEFTNKLHKDYVPYQHFVEVVNAMRQENNQLRSDQKEIRDDLKKILNLLGTVQRSN